MSDPLLSVRDVEAGYGLTRVLQGVTLDVERGSVVSLVGRNGVGKTTTLRSIVGNITPTAGTITFDGEDITTTSTEETIRNGITFVPEERRIFPELTVRENIEMGQIGATATDGPSIDEVLDMFENLREREHSHGSVLSGGEQQMLAIGRALIADPDLLLLDEPTEGLAPVIVEDLRTVFNEVVEQDVTVLITEQNVEFALDLSERAYIIESGENAWEGTIEELRERDDLLEEYLSVGAAEAD